MTDAPESLVFDPVEWVAKEPRTFAKMLDTWRTSCPRLTVWEDAIERGLVMRKPVAGQGTMVVVTEAGGASSRGGREPRNRSPRRYSGRASERDNQASFISRAAFSCMIFSCAPASRSSASTAAMVLAIGASGASDANTTLSAPKKSIPHGSPYCLRTSRCRHRTP